MYVRASMRPCARACVYNLLAFLVTGCLCAGSAPLPHTYTCARTVSPFAVDVPDGRVRIVQPLEQLAASCRELCWVHQPWTRSVHHLEARLQCLAVQLQRHRRNPPSKWSLFSRPIRKCDQKAPTPQIHRQLALQSVLILSQNKIAEVNRFLHFMNNGYHHYY